MNSWGDTPLCPWPLAVPGSAPAGMFSGSTTPPTLTAPAAPWSCPPDPTVTVAPTVVLWTWPPAVAPAWAWSLAEGEARAPDVSPATARTDTPANAGIGRHRDVPWRAG